MAGVSPPRSDVESEALPVLDRLLYLLEFPGQAFDNVGVLGGKIVGFGDVGLDVEQQGRIATDRRPIAVGIDVSDSTLD